MTASIQPALIIGLGGSGIDIVRRFKRRFRTMYPDTPYVRFLGIDTAPQTAAKEALPSLTDDEFVWAAGFRMDYFVGPSYIDQNPSIRGWWRGYDQLPIKQITAGAGMKRPIGRLALFVTFDKIVQRLESQFQAMLSDQVFFDLPPQHRRAVNIYIVSSTCGGTGTGMFLDMAYIARHVASQRYGIEPRVRALLLLPSAFTGTGQVTAQNAANLQLNAYGALTELDAAMSRDTRLQPVLYPNNHQIARDEEPFKSCYLVGNQVEQGAIITDFDELLERAAVHVQIELASPLSQTGVAAMDNVLMAIDVKKSAQGHRRLYSSFSGDWIELPSARVLARWTKQHSLRTINRLRGSGPEEAANDALQRLSNAQGYGSLRTLFGAQGIAPFLPRVDAYMDSFMDVGTEGRSPEQLLQAAQALEAEAQTQITGNTQLPTMVREALDDLLPEIDRHTSDLVGERSLADARRFVTEVRRELAGWLARAQNEIAGAATGRWLADFGQQVNSHRKSWLESRGKFVSDQRQIVIDAAENAREEWRRAVRARIAQQVQARAPALLLSLDEIAERLQNVANVLESAAVAIQRVREPEFASGSAPHGITDTAIDEAYEAAGRPERMDAIARRNLQSDLLSNNKVSAEAVTQKVWDASRQAVYQVAPEYLQMLSIPAAEIADRMNRLSPLAVFTPSWPATQYAKDVARLWMIGIPESMTQQRPQVVERLAPAVREHTQVLTTPDEDRVVITVQNHGFPLYGLQETGDCKRAFDSADPQQRLLCFVVPDGQVREWDVMPVAPQDSQKWFALAMATSRIRRAGQAYVYNSGKNGSIDIPLGTAADPVEARQAARDAFLQGGYGSEVRSQIETKLRADGNQPLYEQLDGWVVQQEKYRAEPAFPADFEREIATVRDYMKSIPPF